MNARPVWRKKRVWIPVLAVGVTIMSCGVAWYLSGGSQLVLYNETGEKVVALRVKACGQTRNFGGLRDEESVGWTLMETGGASEIVLDVEMAGERSWTWRGGYVEPKGGYRVVLRLGPGHEVGLDTQISIWPRIWSSASVSSPDANSPE